jgi:hypothetical protein
MKPVVVESTTLITVAYDADHMILQLEFRDQTIYHYFGVPVDLYRGLLAAPSKGHYFNQRIRDRFPYFRLQTVSLS